MKSGANEAILYLAHKRSGDVLYTSFSDWDKIQQKTMSKKHYWATASVVQIGAVQALSYLRAKINFHQYVPQFISRSVW